jgi:hypothetical protein
LDHPVEEVTKVMKSEIGKGIQNEGQTEGKENGDRG